MKFFTKKAAASLFRSKCRWYELGKKNTKYFYTLEKRRANAKDCQFLEKESGEIITNIDDIISEQYCYYEKLYKRNEDANFQLVNESSIMVPQKLKENQERQINEYDLTLVVKSIAKEKTPGHNGLTVEFYLKFWNILVDPLLAALLESFENKKLYNSLRCYLYQILHNVHSS